MFNNSILDMGTWFEYNLTSNDDEVQFSKLNLIGLSKMFVVKCVTNHNSVAPWTRPVEMLDLSFYPSNYR